MNRKTTTTKPAARHGTIRRNVFATVLVLIALFPLTIFLLTYWMNQAAAVRSIDLRLLRSVQNAERLQREVERALEIAEDAGRVIVQPVYRPIADGTSLYDAYVTPAFRQTLEEIEPGDEMLHFASLLSTRGQVMAAFGEWGNVPQQGDLQVMSHHTPAMLVEEIRQLSKDPGRRIVRLAYPTRIGEHIVGTVIVGLSFTAINEQIQSEVRENNLRALSISLAGSLLLAALGGYLLHLNEKTRTLQSALEQENHLAYIGTLSAGLAHEIRNPLSSIKMNMQMIKRKMMAGENVDKDNLMVKVDRVRREADRLEEAISDFLVFAAPRPLHLERAKLNEVIDEVVAFFEEGDGAAKIVKRLNDRLPAVEIDRDMIVEMLQNLVINARQAAGEDGIVEVETFTEDGMVSVAVSDSGPGVADKYRDRIFEVFYTTKKGGTGLGLNIARRIVEDHGGSIILSDTCPLGGARFEVRLPAAKDRHKSKT